MLMMNFVAFTFSVLMSVLFLLGLLGCTNADSNLNKDSFDESNALAFSHKSSAVSCSVVAALNNEWTLDIRLLHLDVS